MLAEDRPPLIEFLRSRRARYVRFAHVAGEHNPNYGADTFSDDDLGQMVDGFVGVIVEALEGERTEALDFYARVVIPGLIAAGNPVEGIIQTVVAWTVLVVADVTAHFPARDRSATETFLAHFFGRYCRRMVEAAQEVAR